MTTRCATCGEQLSPTDVFCGDCGSRAPSPATADPPDTALVASGSSASEPSEPALPDQAPSTSEPAPARRLAVPLAIAAIAGALVAGVVLVLVLAGGGGDQQLSDSGGAVPGTIETIAPPPTPPTTDPVVTEPPEPTPPTTDPVVTEPPEPDPPAPDPTESERYVVLDGSFADATGSLSRSGGEFLAIDVELDAGQPMRFRVEVDAGVDAQILILSDRATVRQSLELVHGSDLSELDDVDGMLDEWHFRSWQDLNAGPARDTFGELLVRQVIHWEPMGEIEADSYVVSVAGRYTVFAQAAAGGGPSRLVVETSDRRHEDPDDAWWEDLDQAWFFEDRFYWQDEPYWP